MASIVEYILNLKSNQFESGVSSAIGSTNALESAFGKVKSTALGFFSLYQGFEFISDSVREFNEAAQASAQLDASLRSTANAANLNREALDKQSEALAQKSLFDDEAITGLQSVLATFTQVKDKIYMEAVPAILDMSQKMGGDLQGATLQVGKALNDPIHGITALTRVGVTFSEGQKESIKHMVEMNNVAGAQAMILRELQTEFGGSALAATQVGTGPMQMLQKDFKEVKEDIGALVITMVNELRPQLEWFIGWASDSVKWIAAHTGEIKALLAGWIAMRGTAMTLIPLMQGFAAASSTAAVATTELAVAETAALGPIGLVTVAVGALVSAYYLLTDAQDKAVESRARGYEQETKSYESSLAGRMEEQWKQSHKSKVDYIKETNATLEAAVKENDKLFGQALRAGENTDALSERGVDLIHKKNALALFAGSGPTNKTALGGASKPAPPTTTKTQATGSKSITINMSIGKLGEITINTTNLTDAGAKVKEYLQGVLIGILNDSQIALEH